MSRRSINRRSSACAALTLLVFGTTHAVDRVEALRRFAESQVIGRQVPSVAIAVAKDGKILWEQGFGWADRERRIPATANTMYSLASTSKPVTATALMTLVRAGAVDLDHPINEYLGSAQIRAAIGDAAAATVRRVANHSSGLPEHYQFFYANEPWRTSKPEETIARYGVLMTVPGEEYQYSNLGYGILSYMISLRSGEPFGGYVRKHVFLPLGMTRSAVGPEPSLADFVAVRYGRDGLPIPPYETDHPGASEVYASAHDLARFGMFHLKEHLADQVAILPDSLIDAMHKPTTSLGEGRGYGVGFEIRETAGYAVISHDGDMPGVRTELRLIPSERLVVVVLANAEDRIAPIIADEIMSAFLPKWKAIENAKQAPHREFVPPPELVGAWVGYVVADNSRTPIVLHVQADGVVRVKVGDQLETLLNDARLSKDGMFQGVTTGDIGFEDEVRRPHILGFKLKLREGGVINGAITTRTDSSDVVPTHDLFPSVAGSPRPTRVQARAFALAAWAELVKQGEHADLAQPRRSEW
jgi:CubicO group peptidase (beta-lactamase class C family)